MEFKLEGEEYIELQALLKVSGLAETGGAAKMAISAGEVTVDGVVETRRGKKIRQGQTVACKGQTVTVLA